MSEDFEDLPPYELHDIIRRLRRELAQVKAERDELKKSFLIQQKNYLDLYHAVVPDGTYTGSPDPIQMAIQCRAERDALMADKARPDNYNGDKIATEVVSEWTLVSRNWTGYDMPERQRIRLHNIVIEAVNKAMK